MMMMIYIGLCIAFFTHRYHESWLCISNQNKHICIKAMLVNPQVKIRTDINARTSKRAIKNDKNSNLLSWFIYHKFVASLICSQSFFQVTSVIPLSAKINNRFDLYWIVCLVQHNNYGYYSTVRSPTNK